MALTGWGDSNNLSRNAAVGSQPFLVSAWGYSATGLATTRTAYCYATGAGGGDFNRRTLRLSSSDLVEVDIVNATDQSAVAASGAHANAAWFHMSAAYVSATLRRVWRAGGNATDDTNSSIPATADTIEIGSTLGQFSWPAAGALAEVSIWDLTGFDATGRDNLVLELATLQGGTSARNPKAINLQSSQQWTGKLVAYWRLTNTADLTDLTGNGHNLSMNGTVTNWGGAAVPVDAVPSGVTIVQLDRGVRGLNRGMNRGLRA